MIGDYADGAPGFIIFAAAFSCLTSLCRRVQFCELKDFSQAAPFRDNLTQNRKVTKADERRFKSQADKPELISNRSMVWPLLSSTLAEFGVITHDGFCEPRSRSMTDRMKLTLTSLTVMMLPYRIDFPLSVLLVTAIMSAAIVVGKEIWGRMQASCKFMAALSLYHNLKSHPLLHYKSNSSSTVTLRPVCRLISKRNGARQTDGLKYVAC